MSIIQLSFNKKIIKKIVKTDHSWVTYSPVDEYDQLGASKNIPDMYSVTHM